MVGMTAALSVAPGLAGAELCEYRVGYVSQDGMRHQVSLADAQAVRFEVMSPARRFAARKGQRHLPGLWWSSTVAGGCVFLKGGLFRGVSVMRRG